MSDFENEQSELEQSEVEETNEPEAAIPTENRVNENPHYDDIVKTQEIPVAPPAHQVDKSYGGPYLDDVRNAEEELRRQARMGNPTPQEVADKIVGVEREDNENVSNDPALSDSSDSSNPVHSEASVTEPTFIDDSNENVE